MFVECLLFLQELVELNLHSIGGFSVALTRFFVLTFFAFPRFVFWLFFFGNWVPVYRSEVNSLHSRNSRHGICHVEKFWRLGESWISGGDRYSVSSFSLISLIFFLRCTLDSLLFFFIETERDWEIFSSNKVASGICHQKSLLGNYFFL